MPESSTSPPEVAVVIPCHNSAAYLAHAIDSVLVQSYRNFAVFVIDDGSTDGTKEIISRYSDRVSYLHQSQAGPAAARNRGIRMSESRYVAFLDADDRWLPEKLTHQIALLEQNPQIGMVCSDCFAEKSGIVKNSYLEHIRIPRNGSIFEQLLHNCFVFTPTVTVRRECLQDVGLFRESLAISEDFHLWLRIALRWDIAFLPKVLAVRRIHPENLSSQITNEQRWRNSIAVLEDILHNCLDLSPRRQQALQRAIAERHYVYGSCLLADGDRHDSAVYLKKALWLDPTHWRALLKLAGSSLPSSTFRYVAQIRKKLS